MSACQKKKPLMQAAKAEFKLMAGGACTQAKLKHRAKHPYATARCTAAIYGLSVLLQGAALQHCKLATFEPWLTAWLENGRTMTVGFHRFHVSEPVIRMRSAMSVTLSLLEVSVV